MRLINLCKDLVEHFYLSTLSVVFSIEIVRFSFVIIHIDILFCYILGNIVL